MVEKMKEIQEKVGRFFEPDEKICLIFDNVSFDKLRELPEYAQRYPDDESWGSLRNELQYPDMPKAREWADDFEQRIKAYGFTDAQIRRHRDADWNTMQDAIRTRYDSAK